MQIVGFPMRRLNYVILISMWHWIDLLKLYLLQIEFLFVFATVSMGFVAIYLASNTKRPVIAWACFRNEFFEAFLNLLLILIEPVCEKTNNLGSDQVPHKPDCTVTEN